ATGAPTPSAHPGCDVDLVSPPVEAPGTTWPERGRPGDSTTTIRRGAHPARGALHVEQARDHSGPASDDDSEVNRWEFCRTSNADCRARWPAPSRACSVAAS